MSGFSSLVILCVRLRTKALAQRSLGLWRVKDSCGLGLGFGFVGLSLRGCQHRVQGLGLGV